MTLRTAYDREHDRELAKHDWRPGDGPHRLDVQIPTAVEIAVLVKSANLMDGAKLIDQYAKTVASEAKVDVAEQFSRRIDEVLP